MTAKCQNCGHEWPAATSLKNGQPANRRAAGICPKCLSYKTIRKEG